MANNFCKRAQKPSYDTKEDANKAIFETRLRALSTGGRSGQGRKARRCQHCRGFHVVMPDAAPGKAARS